MALYAHLVGTRDDLRARSAEDIVADALDIVVHSTIEGEYRGADVYITLGGPTIWIDTAAGMLRGEWWGDSAAVELPRGIVDAIDDVIQEVWGCRR